MSDSQETGILRTFQKRFHILKKFRKIHPLHFLGEHLAPIRRTKCPHPLRLVKGILKESPIRLRWRAAAEIPEQVVPVAALRIFSRHQRMNFSFSAGLSTFFASTTACSLITTLSLPQSKHSPVPRLQPHASTAVAQTVWHSHASAQCRLI